MDRFSEIKATISMPRFDLMAGVAKSFFHLTIKFYSSAISIVSDLGPTFWLRMYLNPIYFCSVELFILTTRYSQTSGIKEVIN